MDVKADSAAPLPSPWRRRLIGVALITLLAVGAAVAFVVWVRQPHRPTRDLVAEAVRASPFLNVGREAGYVAEATCAECHADIVKTYSRHPMGRSAAVVRGDARGETKSFAAAGYHFTTERRAGELIHQAQKLDGDGTALARADRVVRYEIGSGTRGRSYLFDLDGCLFQSPISWFGQTKTWDLSPGFQALYPPEAPIEPACLFCHVNRADPVPHTRNRYRLPIIENQAAIGCQRCHGPGELHVRARRGNEAVTGAFDDTIVNPRHLPPLLRDNVCEQCHLQGEKRVVRLGREPFDYRPGLPLHLFWSVFVRKPEWADNSRAVGHVEQMKASRCFLGSAGKMGCTSCHDPHKQPAAEELVSDYRRKCLDCHETKPCAVPPAERRRKSPEDSCIGCHMPRFQTSDIAHTAVTDHRVPRRPPPERRGGPPPQPPPGAVPIVNFYRDHLDEADVTAERDLGLALIHLARASGPRREHPLSLALPILEKAVQDRPDDVEALEAQGLALAMNGQEADALKAWQRALAKAPDREVTLGLAAQMLQRQGRRREAVGYLRRLVSVSPANARARVHLAELLGGEGDWSGACRQCEEAVKLNPFSAEARQQLVLCRLRSGERGRAETELNLLLRLHPDRKEKLQSWFAQRSREGGG